MKYKRVRKKEKCAKCGYMRYPHQHHILPKSVFGKIGFIKNLCSDCHEDYHRDLGNHSQMKDHPASFYIKHFIKWMAVGAIILLIILHLI